MVPIVLLRAIQRKPVGLASAIPASLCRWQQHQEDLHGCQQNGTHTTQVTVYQDASLGASYLDSPAAPKQDLATA